MGEGRNKVSKSLMDLQQNALLDFFLIYPDKVKKPDFFIPLHPGSSWTEPIIWQGVKYMPMPIEGEGFEINSAATLSRPKLRIANNKYFMTLLLRENEDFKNARVIRKRTFVQFIDDVNFIGGNPFGAQDLSAEVSVEEFLVAQKTLENKLVVEFELTSPLDLDSFNINSRTITSKYCNWTYRGCGCGYNSLPIEQQNGQTFKDKNGTRVNVQYTDADVVRWNSKNSYYKGNYVFIENDKILINNKTTNKPESFKNFYVCVDANVNKNPDFNPTYWQKDGCAKSLSACKKRFETDLLTFIEQPVAKTLKFVQMPTYSWNMYDASNSTYSLWQTIKNQETDPYGLSHFYVDDDIIVNQFKTSFTIAGWFQNNGHEYYPGLFQTTRRGSGIGFNAYYDQNQLYIDTAWSNQDGEKVKFNQKIDDVSLNTRDLYSFEVKRSLSSPHNYLRYSDNILANGSYWRTTGSSLDSTSIPFNNIGTNIVLVDALNGTDNQGVFSYGLSSGIYSELGGKEYFKYYKQYNTFSVYVTAGGGEGSTYSGIYLRLKTYNFNKPFWPWEDCVATYNLSGSGYVISKTGVVDDEPNFNASIKSGANGWYLLSIGMSKDADAGILGVSFGAGITGYRNLNTGTTPFDYAKNYPDSGVDLSPYDLLCESKAAFGVHKLKLNGGIAYYDTPATEGEGYYDDDFKLSEFDSIIVKKNNKELFKREGANWSDLLAFECETFGLGANQWYNQEDYIANGSFSSWSIWGSANLGNTYNSLYQQSETTDTNPNTYQYYPKSWDQVGEDVNSDELIAYWDMEISGSTFGSQKVINQKSQGEGDLKVSGYINQTANKTEQFYEGVRFSLANATDQSSLPFGGFPATEGFGY
jgi:lambda family phage minor tail protein L